MHVLWLQCIYLKNPDQIKFRQDFLSKLPHNYKCSQFCTKIALHHKNCAIAGKSQNCTKAALRKIAIFWWS